MYVKLKICVAPGARKGGKGWGWLARRVCMAGQAIVGRGDHGRRGERCLTQNLGDGRAVAAKPERIPALPMLP